MFQIDQIDTLITTKKIAGSWLVTGGYKYDKKSFILSICSKLLNQNFTINSHYSPDIKWLECGLTDEAKKEIQKNILAGKAIDETIEYSHKREITVDDVREAIQFLSLKTLQDLWKILVIDPADKMNIEAGNSLLKILEEPPERTVIFLLCQNMGKLLPTIKSRCRKIALCPLSKDELKDKITQVYPSIDNIDLIIKLSDGSFGLAQEICENDGITLYLRMLSFLEKELVLDDLKNFVDEIAENDNWFSLSKKFLLDWIAEKARRFASKNPFLAEDYIDLYQEISMLFQDIDRIYLDKKQTLEAIFIKISGRNS